MVIPQGEAGLFNLNVGACLFEGSLQLLSFGLGDLLLDGSRGSVNKVLGFLQSETEGFLDSLDNLKLGLASGGEDNVEFGLLCRSGLSGCNRAGNCDCSCCRLDTILFLENLSEFLNVFYRKVYQLFCKCFYICHN